MSYNLAIKFCVFIPTSMFLAIQVPLAAAQAIQRTGGGSASVACAFDLGQGLFSCLGSGTNIQYLTSPDGSASVSNDVTISGMTGQAALSMSAISIQASGSAAWGTPPSPCHYYSGIGPTYFSNGNQSVYALVPNGTPMVLTFNGAVSATGGLVQAGWSTGRGLNSPGSYNVTAGPGKITVGGKDYYLLDTIQAGGQAGAQTDCSAPNSSSFNVSVSMQYCVNGPRMQSASPSSRTGVVNTPLPDPLKVQVTNACYGTPLASQLVLFSVIQYPSGGGDFSLTPSALTDGHGYAAASFTPGSSTGTYLVDAVCVNCAGTTNESLFTINAITLQQATALKPIFCDGTYPVGQTDPLIVQAYNTVTGATVPNFTVGFQIISQPGGGTLSQSPVTTDSYGDAESDLTLGPSPGTYSVQANCPDCQANPTVTCPVTAILPFKANQTDPPTSPLIPNSSPNIILAAQSNVIVPSDAGCNVVTPSCSPLIAGSANTATVLVTTTMSWTATVTPDQSIVGDGGHNHDTPRPQGFLGGLSQTSGTGNATLTFTAGQVGEQEEISVVSTDGSQESDAFINVRVPNLVNFESNHGSSAIQFIRTPDNSHPTAYYVNPNMSATLQIIAQAFISSFTAPMSVNDMSLPMGGVFDICAQWDPHVGCSPASLGGHFLHRIGTSVDVNRTTQILNSQPPQFYTLTSTTLNQFLRDLNREHSINCCRIREELLHIECPPLAANSSGGTCDPLSQ